MVDQHRSEKHRDDTTLYPVRRRFEQSIEIGDRARLNLGALTKRLNRGPEFGHALIPRWTNYPLTMLLAVNPRTLQERGVHCVFWAISLEAQAFHCVVCEERGDEFTLCSRPLRRQLTAIDQFIPQYRRACVHAVADIRQCGIE